MLLIFTVQRLPLPEIPPHPEIVQEQLPEGWTYLGPRDTKQGLRFEAAGPVGVASAISASHLVAQIGTLTDITSRHVETTDEFSLNRRRRSKRRRIEDGLFRCRLQTCRALVYSHEFLVHLQSHGLEERDPELVMSAYEDVAEVPDVEDADAVNAIVKKSSKRISPVTKNTERSCDLRDKLPLDDFGFTYYSADGENEHNLVVFYSDDGKVVVTCAEPELVVCAGGLTEALALAVQEIEGIDGGPSL